MNPLFQNAPMGPQGDFGVSQQPPMSQQGMAPMPTTQGPTQGIVTVPQAPIPEQGNMPTIEGLAAPAAQLQPSGIPLVQPNQAPPPMAEIPKGLIAPPRPQAPPKQEINKQMEQHEQGRQLSDSYTSAVQSPEALAFQKKLPSVNWNSVHEGINKAKEAHANVEVPTPYVTEYGSANAVKTAFKGGDYMAIAASFLGKSEGKDHAVLSDVFKKQMGTNIDPRQTPWCAAYVSSVLNQGGVKSTNSLSARSYLKWGDKIPSAEGSRGDVVVFGRGKDPSKGHVGFVDHYSKDGKTVYVLGGNQSNSVSISARPVSQILGVRRPPNAEVIQKHAEQPPKQEKRGTVSPSQMPADERPLSQLITKPDTNSSPVQSLFSRGT